MKNVRAVLTLTALASGAVSGFATEQERFRTAPPTLDPATLAPPGMKFIKGRTDYAFGLSLEEIEAIQEKVKMSSPGELGVFAAAYPQYVQDVEDFYLDVHEVTNREWKAYLDATGLKPSDILVKEYWKDGEIPNGHENHPIRFVTRYEAEDYARWCNKRLPTEFEWEYAARGPERLLYPWGNDFDDPDPRWDERGRRIPGVDVDPGSLRKGGERANCGPTKGKKEPRPVGSFELGASPFGILDMAGNVWEWTSSNLVPYPDHKPFTLRTIFGKEQISGAAFFNNREAVLRGGCYDSKPEALMSVIRQPTSPDTAYNTIGFRCAKSARAGVDRLRYALQRIGHYFIRRAVLFEEGLAALENTRYDDDGIFQSYEGVVFCSVAEWQDDRGRTRSVSKALDELQLPMGVLITTHDMIVPPLPAGTYYVELRPKNDKAKPEKGVHYPDSGWNYAGLTAPSERKSSRKSKDQEKDEENDEGEGESHEEGETVSDIAGSIKLNPKLHNLVLMDITTNKIVASYVVDKMKENVRLGRNGELPPVAIERQRIAEDKRNKIPATERWTFKWAVRTGRKGVEFEMPIRFQPDILSPTATATTSDTPAESNREPGK